MNDYPVNVFLSAPAKILLAILVFLTGSGAGEIIALMSADDWWGIGHWSNALADIQTYYLIGFSPLIVATVALTGVGLIFPVINFFVFWKNLADDFSNRRAFFIYAINQVMMFGVLIIFNVGDLSCLSKMDTFKFFVQASVILTLIYFGHKLTVSAINQRLLPFLERKFNKEET